MPTTARGITYPAGTQAPDVPAVMKTMAETTETAIDAGLGAKILAATTSVNFASLTSYSREVAFGKTFATPPVVVCNIDVVLASAWVVQANNITTTGFTLTVKSASGAAGSMSTAPIGYVAVGK